MKHKSSSPIAKPYKVAASVELYRVDGGIFDFKVGEVMDLTDRKVLFSFPATDNSNTRKYLEERKEPCFHINSQTFCRKLGTRLDIKSYFSKIFKDKDTCFLDVIGLTLPKGAPAIATLRFYCE